jgi:hypothetical protein
MTPQQRSRISEIGTDIKKCKTHPSESTRESVKDFTPGEVESCVEALRKIYGSDDGWTAYMVIKAYYESGESGVLKLHLSGQL